jgi:hypothetical protein
MRGFQFRNVRERFGGLPGEVDDDCLHIRDETAELLAGGDFVPE